MKLDPSTVVLLGAGASAEAGVPTAYAMTDQLEKRLSLHDDERELAATYRLIRDVLMNSDRTNGRTEPLDVERVYAAAELLAERDTLEIAHFVDAWHPQLRGQQGDPGAFQILVDAIPQELRQLVLTAADDSHYLAPMVEAGRRPEGLTIATLNYDLTVEQCADACNIPCDTGMEGWVVYGSWMWPPEGIRLLKLHGSIAEAWGEPEDWEAFMPHQGIYEVDDQRTDRHAPLLAFGRREKLRAAGPFVGLLIQLELLLREAEDLLVIGYSFRDDHINEAITRWSHSSTGRRLIVVDPDWPDDFPIARDDFPATLHRYLVPPKENPRLFTPRLEVLREPCSEALKRLEF